MANVKLFHVRSKELRHDVEDELAHLAWESDLGLAEVSMAASPLYSSTLDRRVVHKNEHVWSLEYRGRFQYGSESEWIDDGEASVIVSLPFSSMFFPFWTPLYCFGW